MTDIIDLALACYRRPLDYQDRLSLAVPLPEGMDRLMWLANGSPEALEAGIRQTGAKPQELRDAARFCIQQWCLVRGADPHRVLGVEPGAPPEQIKEHYRLLMRLFHPDRAVGRETWTDHYASRINEAWAALARMSDRPPPDNQPPTPPHTPARDTVLPRAERAVECPGPLSSRDRPGSWRRARRWRLPRLGWVGLILMVVTLVLAGFHPDHFLVSPSGFEPTGAVGSASPSRLAMVAEPVAAPMADPGALGPFLVAPDWQALEQREQQARQQVVQAWEMHRQREDSRRQQIATEEALLEKMQMERARLEEQIKIEPAHAERETAEQRRLEAVQAKVEHFAETLRIERQRLEKLKVEQARAEQAEIEQANMARVRAGRQHLEEQAKAGQTRVEPAGRLEYPELTAGELESLINRYTRAYRRGDLNGVMALFGAGARGRIEQDYATLFAAHHIRGLWLRDLRWRYQGQSASGSGHYQLRLRRRDNGESHHLSGSIRFTVQKRDGRVLIEAIEYDWPES